jgi:hypothetical protein
MRSISNSTYMSFIVHNIIFELQFGNMLKSFCLVGYHHKICIHLCASPNGEITAMFPHMTPVLVSSRKHCHLTVILKSFTFSYNSYNYIELHK